MSPNTNKKRKMEEKRDSSIFWLVSAPRKQTNEEDLKGKTKGFILHSMKPFDIPKSLKVGTLDSLYGLLDELIKVDSFVETTTKKIAKQMYDLYSERKDLMEEGNNGNILAVANVDLHVFLLNFEWNHAKFKSNSPLKELLEAIASEVSNMDEELRTMQADYSSVGHGIDAIERQKQGNLQVRDLSDVIDKQVFVESNHLTSVFVIIPKHGEKEFVDCYERLCDGIVPRSYQSVITESDQILARVVLFKTSKDEFKLAVAAKKWTLREISMSANDSDDKKEHYEELIEKRDKIRGDLIRWCRSNFTEVFTNWAHLKAIKMFVESILRFGLPRDFVCFIMQVNHKKERSLRKVLDDYYKSLASEFLSGGSTGDVIVPGANETFYAYVFSEIRL